MSEKHQLEKARYEFRQFTRRFTAFRARNTSLFEKDLPPQPFVQVTSSQALDGFLRAMPEFTKLREDITRQSDFFFVEQLWREASVA